MRKYVYRKHLREPGMFFKCMILSIVALYFGTGILVVSKGMEDKLEFLIIYSIIGIGLVLFLSLEMAIIYVLLYKKFRKIEVTLDENLLIYTNSKRTRIIPYEEITYIKQPSIKYTGGWLKIGHKDGDIRLTVVLEGLGDFIKELKGKLDEHGLNEKYKEKSLFSFYKTAQFTDNTWERLYKNIKWLGLILFANYAIALVLAMISHNKELPIPQVLIGFVFPVVGFIISDIILGRKCAKGIKKEEFNIIKMDMEKESQSLKKIVLISAVISITLNLIITISSLMS